MSMQAKPQETCWFQHKICWLCASLLVPRKNLLVLCNEFDFVMLNPFSLGFKRFVLVWLGLTHSLVVHLWTLDGDMTKEGFFLEKCCTKLC